MDSGSGSKIFGFSQVCLLEVSGSDLVIWGPNKGVSVEKSLYFGSFQHYRRFETRCSIPLCGPINPRVGEVNPGILGI